MFKWHYMIELNRFGNEQLQKSEFPLLHRFRVSLGSE